MKIQPSNTATPVERQPAAAPKPHAKASVGNGPAATVKFSQAALKASATKSDVDHDGDRK